jgi:tetratricopeptide (TPR) repeat protein
MAKRKRRRQPARKSAPAPFDDDSLIVPRRFVEGLEQAEQLMKKKRWTGARETLQDLDRRYPGQPAILTHLVNVYYELEDIRRYQSAVERLLKVEPDNADATLGLAGSYLQTLRPVLALRTFRAFLERWPDHARAADARGTIADLEATMPQVFAELGMADGEATWELAIQHEEMQVHLAQGRFSQVHQTAEAILRHHPHFAPALNNLSLAYWAEGRMDRAIASAERVLTFEPDNVHALSNLVHFMCLARRMEQARDYADRLRASTAPASEKALKQMEAFTFLGDDEIVLALFDQAAGTGEREERLANPMLYHLAAVALLRLGREAQARQAWEQALKIQPGFDLARENLDDLRRPVGERHAPWPFPLSSWINQKALVDLESSFKRARPRHGEKGIGPAARRYLKKHPEVVSLLPILLERGDPHARELAVMLIRMAHTPELLEALRAFALGPHGPDTMRIEAANFLSQQGVLPAGQARLYVNGEWQELLLIGFEIGDESEDEEAFPPRVKEMAEQAALALQERHWQQAEQLLNQALTLLPGSPGLLNNLAVAYQLQGRAEEARALIRESHQRHPDYLFARVNLAQMAIRDGELARAHALLEPLLRRKKLHFSEFGSLCAAFIELYLAEDMREGARTWFEMWESADPENPDLAAYRLRVGRLPRAPGRLLRR